MALTPRLELRQGQSLVMTPQLQQAIRLLQLSASDLAAYVEQELERNPLLERLDPEPAAADGPPEAPQEHASAADGDPAPLAISEDSPGAALESGLDVEHDALDPEAAAADRAADAPGLNDWSKVGQGGAGEELPDLEATLTRDVSLAEHLEAQLVSAGVGARERLIGAALIDQVDEWGYFRGDVAEIARQLGAAETAVSELLALMQGFEPVGVMARDLAECLALQLKDRDRFDPAMAALIANLDLLARAEIQKLIQVCGVDRADLEEMIAEIRALSPKPGVAFGGPPAQTVIPDVLVRASPDGAWAVELNPDTLPRLIMNNRYYAEVSRKAKQETEKTFLTECAQTANWLIKSLDQRANTILKVAREIVRQQDGFLAFGVEHLRPLNLKTVAAAIDMHESTVSRVTSNKYMATPRGLFELKYFFTASIEAVDGGEAHSAEAVRHRVKQLIERESADDILSDDRIVEILRESGIDIARRTVAKYRESLRIPSSVERKRRRGRGL